MAKKQAQPPGDDDYIGYHEIGRMIGKSPQTVMRWVLQGLIPSYRMPGGNRNCKRGEVRRFFAGTGLPKPAEEAEISAS